MYMYMTARYSVSTCSAQAGKVACKNVCSHVFLTPYHPRVGGCLSRSLYHDHLTTPTPRNNTCDHTKIIDLFHEINFMKLNCI